MSAGGFSAGCHGTGKWDLWMCPGQRQRLGADRAIYSDRAEAHSMNALAESYGGVRPNRVRLSATRLRISAKYGEPSLLKTVE